ncbi:hypothetical protein HWV23_09655 [Natronomonas halophila]|uniref:hypothetical protein n=1 Tax=Natronomonas halophila TaxID=2747817 RepID=UPI0015B58CBF|nr:hypothetical protein [Natronomonas halophila]QLD85978.1 hypothetical protein HWV23_09655 [Natronomonas halophila]
MNVGSSLRDRFGETGARKATIGLLFVVLGYAASSVLFVIGGLDGIDVAVLLQAATSPVFVGATYLAYKESPHLIGPLAALPAIGGMLHGVGVIGSITEIFGLLLVGSATGVWAVLGYAVGTALRWRRDYARVPEDEVFRACGLVAVCGFAIGITYLFFWGTVVIGLGDFL